MDNNTVEHLKLILNIVDRMGRNSFQIKTWAVILVSAIFALAAREVDNRFLLIGLIPAFTFWGLDGYYLWQERYFRALYNAVRKGEHDIEKYGLFSMNTQPDNNDVHRWGRTCFSRTISGFYIPLITIIAITTVVTYALEKAD